MVSENHLKAINLYSNFDNLTFSILLGMFISLIVFGCLTLILFKLRKRYDKVRANNNQGHQMSCRPQAIHYQT